MNIEKRLNDSDSLVCGVAASIAAKFGWSCFWPRVGWLALVVVKPALFLVVYFALALLKEKWA